MNDPLVQAVVLFVAGSLLAGAAALGVLILAERPGTTALRAMTSLGKVAFGHSSSPAGVLYFAKTSNLEEFVPSAMVLLSEKVFKVVDERTDQPARVSYRIIANSQHGLILFQLGEDFLEDSSSDLQVVSMEEWTVIVKKLIQLQERWGTQRGGLEESAEIWSAQKLLSLPRADE